MSWLCYMCTSLLWHQIGVQAQGWWGGITRTELEKLDGHSIMA